MRNEIGNEMTRRSIEIKRIEKVSSRQVAFSKRRKGLFKKAQELSTLCDADIALIVFSATTKLFHYSSSSMEQVIERRTRHPVIHRSGNSSIALQVDSESNCDMLRKKEDERTRELRQLNGEDLQGMTLQELQKLEEQLIRGFISVSKAKDEKLMQEISTLKRKGVELTAENRKLNQKSSVELDEHGQIRRSSCCFPDQNIGGCDTDTSLKLGLP